MGVVLEFPQFRLVLFKYLGVLGGGGEIDGFIRVGTDVK